MSETADNGKVTACSSCKEEQEAGRRDTYCKKCRREYAARWRKENPEANAASYRRGNAKRAGTGYHLRSHLKNTYGLELEDFEAMVEMQDGLCEVCLREPEGRLHVDHCHATGRIRGLLCGNCNRALGLLKESAENARRAMVYLEIEGAW